MIESCKYYAILFLAPGLCSGGFTGKKLMLVFHEGIQDLSKRAFFIALFFRSDAEKHNQTDIKILGALVPDLLTETFVRRKL